MYAPTNPHAHALLLLLLLLLLPLLTTAQQSTCSRTLTIPIGDIEPFLSQYDFSLDCYAAQHRIPASGTGCTRHWTNGKLPRSRIGIKVCPPAVKDPLVWQNGVRYDCMDVANRIRTLVAECGKDGGVAGRIKFGVQNRGEVVVRMRTWFEVIAGVMV